MALLERKLAPPPSEPAPDRAPDRLAAGAAQPLRGELEALLGTDRVLARASDIVRYASDASPYRLFPQVVVMAHDAGDVAKVLAYGRRRGIPVTFRAGGTSLNGQGQSDGILVDVRRHFGGVAVEDGGALARVKPGTVLGHANRVLAPHGRKLGPDPASTDIACVGGVIANNSGGMRCGVTKDSYSTVRSMTLVLASGNDDRHRRPGRRRALRRGGARAGRRARRDPRRDPRRRRAERADPPQVRDQEHDRLPALRLPRRRRAAGDLPPPCGRLRGHTRLRRRGGLRDRAAARPDDHGLDPLPRHRRGDRPGPRPGRERRHRGRADGRAGIDHRRLEHGRCARGVEGAAARVGGAAGRVRRRQRRGARRLPRQGGARSSPATRRSARSSSPARPRGSSWPGACARACTGWSAACACPARR